MPLKNSDRKKTLSHFTKLLVCFYFPPFPQQKTQYALNKRERKSVHMTCVILFHILVLRVLGLGDLIKFLDMPISKTEYPQACCRVLLSTSPNRADPYKGLSIHQSIARFISLMHSRTTPHKRITLA